MKLQSLALALALATSATFAAADTTLVLKPSAEQTKAAKAVGNKICPVSGDTIGGMGEGKTVIYQGKSVKLCCAGCLKKFAKDPAKFLAIAEASTKPAAHKSDAKKEGMEMPEGHDMKGMK